MGVAQAALGAIGAVVARFVHTEEVTGSNPVSPTVKTLARAMVPGIAGLSDELIHHGRACLNDRPNLMPIHDLGDSRRKTQS